MICGVLLACKWTCTLYKFNSRKFEGHIEILNNIYHKIGVIFVLLKSKRECSSQKINVQRYVTCYSGN